MSPDVPVARGLQDGVEMSAVQGEQRVDARLFQDAEQQLPAVDVRHVDSPVRGSPHCSSRP